MHQTKASSITAVLRTSCVAFAMDTAMLSADVTKLETAALRPPRLKPASTWDGQLVGVGFSRRVRESAGSTSFETPSSRRGQCVACRFAPLFDAGQQTRQSVERS